MALQGKTFAYEASEINSLEATLSPERFHGYLIRVGHDRVKAIRLYERNTALSEALYGVVQGLEVALRNRMHETLSAALQVDWYTLQLLKHPQDGMVESALEKLTARQKPHSPGRVVAELSFGFWTGLIGPRYEKTLWVPFLHRAFPNAKYEVVSSSGKAVRSLNRSQIVSQLEEVRQLRNRIAHHERILDYDLPLKYSAIVQCIGWLCPVTAAWVDATNCFQERFAKV